MNSFLEGITPRLMEYSQRSFGRDINWLMVSNGAADLNDNVIFFGFKGSHPEPSFVAKVPRSPSNAWVVQTEYEHLVDVWERLGSDANLYIPEPVDLL